MSGSSHRSLLRPDRRATGSTLIEWLVVLALVAILTSLAVPGIGLLMRSHQVRQVANDLLADLNWSRAEAMRRGVQVRLSIHPASQCLPQPATGQQRCGWKIVLGPGKGGPDPGDPVLRRYELPAGVDLPDITENVFAFQPNGDIAQQGNHVVVAVTGVAKGQVDAASRVLCTSFGARTRIAPGHTCL